MVKLNVTAWSYQPASPTSSASLAKILFILCKPIRLKVRPMSKVTFDYPPQIARKKLLNLFSEYPSMIIHINDMCDSQAIVFSAMCDGKSVTNAGNRIEADYEVTKLAAVIDVLENRFFLPVSRIKVHTVSDTGGATIQAKYTINPEDLEVLLSDPDGVISSRKMQALFNQVRRDERCLKRLISIHGYEEVFKTLQAMAPANDSISRKFG